MNEKENMILELLMAELTEEADRIIKEVESDRSLEHIVLPDDMDTNLAEMIREYETAKSDDKNITGKDQLSDGPC